MPENDFEKQVKETMEGFTLKPSESVWNKIEVQLPKKDNRRFIAFFFLFAGLMVCGYYFYGKLTTDVSGTKAISLAAAKTEETNNDLNKLNLVTATDKNIAPQDSAQDEATLKNHNTAEATIISSSTKEKFTAVATTEKNTPQSTSQQPYRSISKEKMPPAIFKLSNSKTQPQMVDTGGYRYNGFANTSTEKSALEILSTNTAEALAIIEKPVVELPQKDSSQTQLPKDSFLTAATKTKKETIQKKTNKKWQWGITAAYGKSNIVESLLGNNSTDKSLVAPGSTNSSGGLSQGEFATSNTIKAKSSFTVGISIKKTLSPKNSLITGLQYAQYSTRVETGNLKDSSATFTYSNLDNAPETRLSNYYTPGAGIVHQNNYQLLQLPIIFEQQLNRSNRLALNWNAGLSITQLLSSNALIFDYANQAVYHNNELYRKTQIDMLAGINVQFAAGKNSSVNIGPQFQYSLSNLLRSKSYGYQHFINYGLKASIFFKK